MADRPPEPPQPLRGVLFDLDGTLVDSEPLHLESALRVLAAHGVRPDPGGFADYTGWAELPFWAELRRRFGLAEEPSELAEQRTAAYLELLHGRSIEPLPGVTELLDLLAARGVPVAIASSSPRAQIDASLRAAGLAERFPIRVSGHDDVAAGKPAPDVYLAAAAAVGAPPAACLALEDSLTGGAAARAAGVFTVLIPGPHLKRPPAGVADRVLASIPELVSLLAGR